jgi:hypothetical protein
MAANRLQGRGLAGSAKLGGRNARLVRKISLGG